MKKSSILTGIAIIAVVLAAGVFACKYFTEQQNTAMQPVSEGCKIQPYKGNIKSDYALDNTIVTDVRGGAICRFLINPGLPAYTFRLIGDPKHDVISKIEISQGNSHIVQIIDLSTITDPLSMLSLKDSQEPPYRDAEFFTAKDINSDGYKDIRLLSWWGVTGREGYYSWLFDPKNSTFTCNGSMEK